MYERFAEALNAWNSSKPERVKLQHTYLVLTIVIVFVSGVISLFNATDGHNAIKIALASIVIFFANAIVWSLLDSSVLSKLKSKPNKR